MITRLRNAVIYASLGVMGLLSPPQSVAIEVGDVKIVDHPDRWTERRREYSLITNGKSDQRFYFAANELRAMDGHFFWSLRIVLANADQWAPEVRSNEYLEAIYSCVDQFAHDFPDANVASVWIEFTDDSKLWAEIRKSLVSVLEEKRGPATEFPAEATETVVRLLNTSPYMHEIASSVARRLNRESTAVHLASDGIALDEQSHGKPWNSLLKTPHLGIAMSSISVTIGLKPLDKPVR
ncbi:MAG: hypothetical protein ABJF10_15455 [Chthoniobacter sp.]|uniref:hypothetical protein n=1 Tax=Chthoniobacter sp. TaxID=2510640 RepID=UPI0032A5FCAF